MSPAKGKSHWEANLPERTSMVQECSEFKINQANKHADIKVVFGLIYCKWAKVQLLQKAHLGPLRKPPRPPSPVKFGYPPNFFRE